ncbi:MAG: GAF domain-containing protein [Acidobacteriota bacterium]|nr:GAF domain-containing protein [Acidobacteriota bacterium]
MPGRKPLQIRQLHTVIFSLTYIYGWTFRAKVRSWLARWAIGLLAAVLFYVPLEIGLDLYGRTLGTASSIAVRVVFFVLIAVSLYGKLREWREHHQKFYFIQAAWEVVQFMSAPQEALAGDEVILKLLAVFAKTFERKGKTPKASVAVLGPDGRLRLKYFHPEAANFDADFEFIEGEGGAGYCSENRCLVYIPKTSYGHGIIQNIEEDQPYRVMADLFIPSGSREIRSILSVPMVAYGTCFGALNFDSTVVNAFHRLDFEQAMYFGFVVAQLLHLRGNSTVPVSPRLPRGT